MGAVLLLALIVAWVIFLVTEARGKASPADHKAFGYLTAILILALFTLLIAALGRSIVGLILGRDRRISTSKLQIAMWTFAISFGLLSLVAMTWVGLDAGFDALTDPSFDFEDYLFLLGGPFAAAVSARYLTGAKVQSGELAKPPALRPHLGDAVSDDEENADLVDTQYLLFNLVALVYFFGAFIDDPAAGFPDIPPLLFSLTSISAATYIANKAVARAVPTLTGIYPQKGKAPDEIDVLGMNLLYPQEVDAIGNVTAYYQVSVTIGGLRADVVEGSMAHAPTGDDRFKVTVPAGLPVGPVDVRVLNFRGVEAAPAKQFEVMP